MNLFEQAVRQQITFNFRGLQNIVTLYDAAKAVSTKSPNSKAFKEFVDDLKNYGVNLTERTASFNKQSIFTSHFEDITSTTKEQKEIELKLAIVTLILTELHETIQNRINNSIIKRKREKLLELKAKKQSQAQEELTIEEIDAELAKLTLN